MKNYSKPVSIIARIAEVFLRIGTIMLAVFLVWSFFDKGLLNELAFEDLDSLSIMGLSVEASTYTIGVFRTVVLYGILSTGLASMIARNIYLISKSMTGKEINGEHSPFTSDNVRMVREIGIFSISIVILGIICSWILFLISHQTIEMDVNLNGILFGVVILWLSTIFQYGHNLEHDVDGLV